MRVIVTGPESSGTNYVTRLLASGGADALHRSQPEGADWIDVLAMLDHPASGYDRPVPPYDYAVVVIRGLHSHMRSMLRRNIETHPGEALSRRNASLGRLGAILGDPRVLVVTYESLTSETERRFLLATLGLDSEAAVREPFYDENRKYDV
jgi:hypothetical protein